MEENEQLSNSNWTQQSDEAWEIQDHSLRRPKNAFLLFTEKFRLTLPEEFERKSNVELTKIISQKWKEMNDDEKERYKQKASELFSEFKNKNPNYNYKKVQKKKKLNKIAKTLSENPLLEAQIVSGQFGSDVFHYPVDPNLFFLFTIGNRYINRALHGKPLNISSK